MHSGWNDAVLASEKVQFLVSVQLCQPSSATRLKGTLVAGRVFEIFIGEGCWGPPDLFFPHGKSHD